MVGSGRNILWMIILSILITIPLWKPFLIDFLSPPGFEYLKKKENTPVDRFVLQGMRFSRSKDGIVDTAVRADRASGGNLSGEIFLQDVEIVLFDQNDKKAGVTSSKGSYDPEKMEVILPGEFIFTSESARIKGQGLYYDLRTGNYRIDGGVICELNPASNQS